MRKQGTILSPECKTYAKDLEQLTGVPEYINLQYLRTVEMLVCQRILEKILNIIETTNDEDSHFMQPITVEIPLIGELTIKPKLWHKTHIKTGKPSVHYDFSFEPLPAFKSNISKIYTNKECNLIALLSESYSDILVNTYKNALGDF